MQLDKLAEQDSSLRNLLQKLYYFQRLDTQVKHLLPPNLAPHFRVVCVRDGALMIHVSGSMAASRLKMLLPALLSRIQALDAQIESVKISVSPQSPDSPKEKNFEISPTAVEMFAETAERVRHHADLYESLQNLVRHHQAKE